MKWIILLISLPFVQSQRFGTCSKSTEKYVALKFPGNNTISYAKSLRSVYNSMLSYTLCHWSKPNGGTIFSYATDLYDNSILSYHYKRSDKISFYSTNGYLQSHWDRKTPWVHTCFTWSKIQNRREVYINGFKSASSVSAEINEDVSGGGVVILGQDQDFVGGGFSAIESFSGDVTLVRLWNYILTPDQILQDYECNLSRGNVLDWFDTDWEVVEGVTVFYTSLPCGSMK